MNLPGDTPGTNPETGSSVRPGINLLTGYRLLWRSAWRYAMHRPWQTILNILGIMVGVMMVVAVDLANNSARQAFDTSIALLNGQISHQISGGSSGIDDSVYTRLKTELGNQKAAPAISGQIRVNGQELTLIGVDVIAESVMQRSRPGVPDQAFSLSGNLIAAIGSADSVVMEESLAQSLNLNVGDSFSVNGFGNSPDRPRQARLAAVFKSSNASLTDELIFADIAAAQYLLRRPGSLDAIDLILAEDQVRQLRNWLPANVMLQEAQVRNDNLRQMSDAFHINLMAMSLLSLLVAGLLIYNTVTLSVIQRQQTLAIFRAQGVTQGQVFALVMLENAVIGFIASVMGVVTGFFLGRFLVTMVTATVDNLYFDLAVSNFFVDPQVLFKGLVLGVLLSLVSALLPSLKAALSRPVTLYHQAAENNAWQKKIQYLALPGIIFMILGWALLLPDYGSLVTGFIALTLMVFGYCLLVPLFLYALLWVILKVAGGNGKNRKWLGLPGLMALRNAQSAINRTGLAVAALCVAVSVTVGVGVMVGSFRGTVILWLEQSLPGDIQVTAGPGDGESPGFPDDLLAELAGIDGIDAMYFSNLEAIESEFGTVRLAVNEIPAQERIYVKEVTADGLAEFMAGQGVFISEPLAYLQKLNPGDSISLLTEKGMKSFPILGTFYDYTSGAGLIHMHSDLFQQHWLARRPTRLTLDLNKRVETDLILASIQSTLAEIDKTLNVISNQQLRQITLQIFDRTFAITNVLRLLSILVAFIGVVSTLMALQMERLREFAILRATGMTPLQITSLIMKQTAVLGFCAGVLALPLGLLMSDVLIDVINRRSFGWSMQHFLPGSILIEGFALAVIAALLAGCYPAWRASRIKPALAMRGE